AGVRPPFAHAVVGERLVAHHPEVAGAGLPEAVGPLEEANLGVEVLADLRVLEVSPLLAILEIDKRADRALAPIQPGRLGPAREATEGQRLADAPFRVRTPRAVPGPAARAVTRCRPVDEDAADARSVRQIAAQTRGGEVVGRREADPFGLHVEQSDIHAP